MKNNMLEYKGYHAKIEFNVETYKLRGKIEGINDFVDFESKDAEKIEDEFHFAVDDYLTFCKEVGKEPEKEYKGTFNIRISPEVHKKLAIKALKEDATLNSTVEKAIKTYLADNTRSDIQQETILVLSRQLESQRIYNRKSDIFAMDGETKYFSDSSMPKVNMRYQ